MSQIQIRQMPTTNHSISGLWFPTGYYGHFRAKSRAELCNHFRQLAQPNPPRKFLHRQNSEAGSHIFSQHDNRFKFENDPLVRCTQAGFGKRRAQTNARGEFDPFFIGSNAENPKTTTSYTKDYSRDTPSLQILPNIPSINNSSPPSEVSMYSSVYGHGQPDTEQSKQIRQETFQRYSTTQTRRLQVQESDRSFNVASCLVWNTPPEEENKPKNRLVPVSIKSRHSFHNMPTVQQPKLRHTESLESIRSIDDRYNFTTGSLGQARTNSVECLISKYM